MITTINWRQHLNAWEHSVLGTITVVNPNTNRYLLVTGNYVLAEVMTDGNDETGDIENAITLCRLHYQHSLGGT